MARKKKPAVLLLSGGLDSATVLAIAQKEGFEVHAISFSYGQRHNLELKRAKQIAKKAGVKDHRIAKVDLRLFGKSALTDDIAVPKARSLKEIGKGIPVTYVPARNTIFLSLALGFAESIGAYDIFIGVNALDYSGYPDCRPEYIKAFEKMANLATKSGVEGKGKIFIHTPLIRMTKAEIIRTGMKLGVDYGMTISCYDPIQNKACGRCDACLLRRKGFFENSLPDPAE
jgi:7-cyano-7-deazaguanine synthase